MTLSKVNQPSVTMEPETLSHDLVESSAMTGAVTEKPAPTGTQNKKEFL